MCPTPVHDRPSFDPAGPVHARLCHLISCFHLRKDGPRSVQRWAAKRWTRMTSGVQYSSGVDLVPEKYTKGPILSNCVGRIEGDRSCRCVTSVRPWSSPRHLNADLRGHQAGKVTKRHARANSRLNRKTSSGTPRTRSDGRAAF
jgi:hypothetical protein